MQIDWLTVSAQLINFLVLVWLLQRFLYRPVLDAMDKREARIASRLAEADRREANARDEARAWREKTEAFERKADALLVEAREAAERQRRTLVEAARTEVEATRERWQQAIVREQQDFREALERELAASALEVAKRLLADLAHASLQHEALATLARRLESLPEEERAAMAAAAPRLRLASAFEVDARSRDELVEALARTLGTPVELECVRKPELLLGVELVGNGRKLDWNAAAWLEEFAGRVQASLADKSRAPSGGA